MTHVDLIAKMKAVLLAAKRDAYARLSKGHGADPEELFQAVLADPRVEALMKDPSYRAAMMLDLMRQHEPTLLKAAENGYDGAVSLLIQKMRARLEQIKPGLGGIRPS